MNACPEDKNVYFFNNLAIRRWMSVQASSNLLPWKQCWLAAGYRLKIKFITRIKELYVPLWQVAHTTLQYLCGDWHHCWASASWDLIRDDVVYSEILHLVKAKINYHKVPITPVAVSAFPASTIRRPNAVSMLAHRLRRWPNIEPTLGQRIVFAGLSFGFQANNLKEEWALHC